MKTSYDHHNSSSNRAFNRWYHLSTPGILCPSWRCPNTAMRYEHTPRPEIEQHYHIRELIEGQEKKTADRAYHMAKNKARAERGELIADNKDFDIKDFYCTACRKDFVGAAWKQEEVDWANPTQTIAFYKTKCWCGKWCIRYITDKPFDPYFALSRRLAMERTKHVNDILQPFETGFNLMYGKK